MATEEKLMQVPIPVSVPVSYQQEFIKNYSTITKNTGRLFLFAADHKMEHIEKDFYGLDAFHGNPLYLFDLAGSSFIGAFATHLGLIMRYARSYPHSNYIAKLNGKTSLVSLEESDPQSRQLWTIQDVLEVKKAGIPICGVGYTIYLGSVYESAMLQEAAQIVYQAHRVGLVTILWVYPRGRAIHDEQRGLFAVGAASVATSLGSDFVKIKPPHHDGNHTQGEWLYAAQQAAGTTKVICSGQEKRDAVQFLRQLDEQLKRGCIAGAALGRNIFQRPKAEAEKFMCAVAALIYENADIKTVLDMYTAP